MLKLENKRFKVMKMGKWLVIVSMLTHISAHAEDYLQTDPQLLAKIGAFSFNTPDHAMAVIEAIITNPNTDPLEILEHLEEIGNTTNNETIKVLVTFIKNLIIELTKEENKNKNDAQKKSIILKHACKNKKTLDLINPVDKMFDNYTKETRKQLILELEQRIKKSRFHHKYFKKA